MTIRSEARETSCIIQEFIIPHQTTPSKRHELALWKAMLFFGPASAWSPAKYAYEVDKGEKNGKHKIWIATDKTRMELDQMR